MAGDQGALALVAAAAVVVAVAVVEVQAAAVEQSDDKGTVMKKALILAALGFSVSHAGCTGTRLARPPLCDGHHKRTANPHGSILPSLPIPQPPSAGDPAKTSRNDTPYYPSC